MDVKGILEKIDTDARDAAQQTLADAQRRADEIALKSRERTNSLRADMEKRVESDAAEAAERMARMRELEDKKATLSVKRGVMDKAFDEALAILLALLAKQARDFFMEELLKTSLGGEMLSVGGVNPDWYDDSFLAQVNEALSSRGMKPVSLSDEKTNGRGFRLIRGGASMDCTFASLIQDKRMALESDVAQALFI